jgi:hypothetical protein
MTTDPNRAWQAVREVAPSAPDSRAIGRRQCRSDMLKQQKVIPSIGRCDLRCGMLPDGPRIMDRDGSNSTGDQTG